MKDIALRMVIMALGWAAFWFALGFIVAEFLV